MLLKNLVLDELEQVDLKGAKVTDLLWEGESVNVSFEINEMLIDFTAKEEAEPEVLRLTLNDQVYSDESTLSKCSEWAKYVWSVVNSIIRKHSVNNPPKVEVARSEENESTVPLVEKVDTRVEVFVEEADKSSFEESRGDVTEVGGADFERETVPLDAEAIVTDGAGSQIEEAVEAAHKEGYKAARKKNAQELKRLKRKYRLLLFFTIVLLIGAFVAFWIFQVPILDTLGIDFL